MYTHMCIYRDAFSTQTKMMADVYKCLNVFELLQWSGSFFNILAEHEVSYN